MKKFGFILLLFALQAGVVFGQKTLKTEGGKQEKSVSKVVSEDKQSSSRVIFQSDFPLSYKSNMGDITEKDVRRGRDNGRNSDTIYFFLPPEDCKRTIIISTDGYSSAKVMVELSTKSTYQFDVFDPVIIASYQGNYDRAVDFLTDGIYTEALKSFKVAKECKDIPADNDIDDRIAKTNNCIKYSNNALRCFEKAETLRKMPNRVITSNQDSVTYFHNLAKRFRGEVLKINPADKVCLKYNEDYDEILPQIDRVVTGKVVDNLNQSIAIPNVSIYGITNNGKSELLATSGDDGSFSVWVNGKFETVNFVPENNPNYQKPYSQKLELGQHYKLFIKLAPKKR